MSHGLNVLIILDHGLVPTGNTSLPDTKQLTKTMFTQIRVAISRHSEVMHNI